MACGTEYDSTDALPETCIICADDRQYVPDFGQKWTTEAELKSEHRIEIKEIETGLFQLVVRPSFSIGQRALLVTTDEGNLLWDCVPILDEECERFIKEIGGLRAIAISHPHFHSNMNRWAETFDCPILLHEADERWTVNRGPHVEFWQGKRKDLWKGLSLYNIGGHFPGSQLAMVPFLSEHGTILCGDAFVLSPSGQHFAAMHSYPNRIPLPIVETERLKKEMSKLDFDTIHAWNENQTVKGNAKEMLLDSLARYF